MRSLLLSLLLLTTPFSAYGAELSNETLVGKWNFAYMVLDGETNRTVNRLMQFLPNGEVINYDKSGAEVSRASFTIKPGVIVYSDKRGEQSWKVKQFAEDTLVVNHSGAEMFFEKQP